MRKSPTNMPFVAEMSVTHKLMKIGQVLTVILEEYFYMCELISIQLCGSFTKPKYLLCFNIQILVIVGFLVLDRDWRLIGSAGFLWL